MTYLLPDEGKCLHYDFYFVDEQLGLCYVRVPTWLPCRLQIYFNGHNWLASQLRKRKIDYRLLDNAFVQLGDWAGAQQIVHGWEAKRIHRKLDEFAQSYCPIFQAFAAQYHWSVDQCEYATDIVFGKQADLQAIHENLARTAIHTIKPDNIATSLGRRLSTQYEGEMVNRFNIRIEGTRIKHTMGPVSLKLYDKFGLILRVETPMTTRCSARSCEVVQSSHLSLGVAKSFPKPKRLSCRWQAEALDHPLRPLLRGTTIRRLAYRAPYRPKNPPVSGPTEPSGNRRRGSGGTGIPNLSCHRRQTAFVNTPAGAFPRTFRNSSNGIYRSTTATSVGEP